MTFRPDDPLLQGYLRFRTSVWPRHAERYARLARRRQHPGTAVVACSDARVDPQTIFDAEPGELFVIRNVAGLVPEYAPDGGCHGTSAALEYAVRILKVRRIVLLGHTRCDGIHAMIHGPLRKAPDFLGPWVDIAEPVMWPIPDRQPGQTLEDTIESQPFVCRWPTCGRFPGSSTPNDRVRSPCQPGVSASPQGNSANCDVSAACKRRAAFRPSAVPPAWALVGLTGLLPSDRSLPARPSPPALTDLYRCSGSIDARGGPLPIWHRPKGEPGGAYERRPFLSGCRHGHTRSNTALNHDQTPGRAQRPADPRESQPGSLAGRGRWTGRTGPFQSSGRRDRRRFATDAGRPDEHDRAAPLPDLPRRPPGASHV